MRDKSVVQPPRQFDRKLKICKTFLGTASKKGVVSDLLVERMSGFVLSLES